MTALEALEGVIGLLPDAAKKSGFGSELRNAAAVPEEAQKLCDRAEDLIRLAACLGALNHEGRREQLEELVYDCLEAGKALEEARDAPSLARARQKISDLRAPVNNLNRSVVEDWQACQGNVFRPLKPYGELLKQIGGLERLGEEFVQLAEDVARIRSGDNASTLLNAVTAAFSRLEELQVRRSASLSDPAIGAFLNALAEQRATLSDLSEEVLDWLRDRNALSRFEIRPKT